MRVVGLAVAALLITISGGPAAANGNHQDAAGPVSGAASLDVAALLASARGAPPLMCVLAAQSVKQWGWGGYGDQSDAPSTPLKSIVSAVNSQLRLNDGALAPEDIERLMSGISSDDACVREMSIRVLGTQRKDDRISRGLIARLAQNDASIREVAAFGLGLSEPAAALEPLIRTLRDESPGVRANSAWALGRMENGRALAPLTGMFRDNAQLVREAAVVAVGHMESTASVPALIRVLREDQAAPVRRVAAWALGKTEAREGVSALASALARDADVRVREMSAWALGSIEDRSATGPLSAAAQGDADERVRESAVWALGQIEDESALEVLGAVAGGDRSSRVRGTAAWAIGQLNVRGAKAPAGLLRALSDESDRTRLKAAWALGEFADADAQGAIRNALNAERSNEVRRALIRALMKSGGRSEAALTQLLTSTDPQVREAAVRGLAGRNSFNPWPWPEPRPRPFP